jgi:hypothetical protein
MFSDQQHLTTQTLAIEDGKSLLLPLLPLLLLLLLLPLLPLLLLLQARPCA